MLIGLDEGFIEWQKCYGKFNAGVTSYNYTPGDYQVALNNLAAATYMF